MMIILHLGRRSCCFGRSGNRETNWFKLTSLFMNSPIDLLLLGVRLPDVGEEGNLKLGTVLLSYLERTLIHNSSFAIPFLLFRNRF